MRQCWRTCEQAIEAGTVDGQRHATTGFAGLLQGKILYEWNDLEAAERCLQEGLDLLRRGGIGAHFGNLYATLAQTRQARGDPEGARSTIERAVQTAQSASIPRLVIQALAYQARIWLAQGELVPARRWARDYRQIGATEYIREFEDCTLARVLLADDQPGEALALLDGMVSSAEDGGRSGTLIEILALRALARQALGEGARSMTRRARSMTWHAPSIWPSRSAMSAPLWIWENRWPGCSGRQRRADSHRPTRASLLAAFGDEGARGLTPAPPRTQPLVEPLSDRELEVLHLLAEGLSNPEIGQRLFISLPTVKSHTRNIYGKLGVHSRKQAVVQARVLGILPRL